MRAWSRLCQLEPLGTPAAICQHRQSAADPPRFLALFLQFYLIGENMRYDHCRQ